MCRSQIQRKIAAEEQRKKDVKARAKAMATALATIGKSLTRGCSFDLPCAPLQPVQRLCNLCWSVNRRVSSAGKFVIKKKVGDADQIFGSVTGADVVAAIEQQALDLNPCFNPNPLL